MVDRAYAELDRQANRAELRESIPVQAQNQPSFGTRGDVTPCLLGVERAALEEDVRRLGQLGCSRQNLAEREVEVVVGSAELRRDGVRAQPRWDPTRRPYRAERRQLRLTIEAVADFDSKLVVPARSIHSRCRRTASARATSSAARVARTVAMIPPPAACSSS